MASAVLAAAGPRPPAPPGPAGSGPGCSAGGDVGVVRAVGGLGDGQRAFLQRPGPLRIPRSRRIGPGCSGRWRRRGGPGRRPPHRWPARVPAAAGPPPDPQVLQDRGQVVQARWRRRGGPGRRPPRRWPAPVPAAAGPPRMPQVLQDRGQVVQPGADDGVVRAVGRLIDGQRAFLQCLRVGELRLHLQVGSGPVQQPRGVCHHRRARLPAGVIGVAGGGQHMRQQHRPPRPILRGTRYRRAHRRAATATPPPANPSQPGPPPQPSGSFS